MAVAEGGREGEVRYLGEIEAAPAAVERLLRKAAERTVEGLWTAIGHLIDVFTPTECAKGPSGINRCI